MSSQKPTKHLALYREYVACGDRVELVEAIARRFEIERALYAGSYVHITPSLVFPSVTYVDSDKRTRDFFSDASVLSFVTRRKRYPTPAEVKSHFADYSTDFGGEDASFDLLISQFAGFVSQACKRYLKSGGYLLTNNSHGDASMAWADTDYQLIAAVTPSNKIIETDLDQYFIPKKPVSTTAPAVRALGRGIGYTKPAPHYVFRRR